MSLVVLKKFSHPVEAHLLKSRLESEGIESFVADENIVGLNWFYSNAVGGVRLQVNEQDLEKAQAILNETQLSVEELAPQDRYKDLSGRNQKILIILALTAISVVIGWYLSWTQ